MKCRNLKKLTRTSGDKLSRHGSSHFSGIKSHAFKSAENLFYARRHLNWMPRRSRRKCAAALLAILIFAGSATIVYFQKKNHPPQITPITTGSLNTSSAQPALGMASFYGYGEKLNKKTSNGETFNPSKMTAASYKFYMKTVRVTSLRTGREVTVFVNDKGPNRRLNRLIDLSRESFLQLEGSLYHGLAQVKVEVVS